MPACQRPEPAPKKSAKKHPPTEQVSVVRNQDPRQDPRPQDDRPNLLLISLDTVRADALGSYGATNGGTPTLDRFAAEGTRMAQSWAQAPSTTPTHSSLFTGAYVYEHGALGHDQRLSSSWTTLAEHLSGQGYRTFALTSSAKFREGTGFDQGFHTYEVNNHDKFTDRSAHVVERLGEELVRDADRPSFGFVHLMDAHAPYDPPSPWRERYLDGPSSVPPKRTVRFIRRHQKSPKRVTPEQRADLRRLYDGGVAFVDHRVSQIRELITASPRPTLVVIVSDHGEAFGENGYLGHSSVLWEEVLQVPWILWGPGIPAGQVVDSPVSTVDVMPTLAALAGAPLIRPVSGRDLSAAIRTGTPIPRRDIIVQSTQRWGVIRQTDTGLVKLVIRNASGRASVHELDDDAVREGKDTTTDPTLLASLQATLAGHDLRQASTHSEMRTDLSAEELEQLRLLGYLD